MSYEQSTALLHVSGTDDHPAAKQSKAARECRTPNRPALGWSHTVNFGRPWYPGSRCSYGLISLPYLDGPKLEWLGQPEEGTHFLWLIPITGPERHFKIESGIEALEQRFEEAGFDYLDPFRASVV